VERTLEEGDVAEHFQIAACRRVALQPAAALSQQNEREIRPFGLPVEPVRQGSSVGPRERFLCDDSAACSSVERLDQLGDVGDHVAAHAGLGQHVARDDGIATVRGKDERPL